MRNFHSSITTISKVTRQKQHKKIQKNLTYLLLFSNPLQELFLQNLNSILIAGNLMSNSPLMNINFVVIASLEGLIPEKVDSFVILQKLETVSLIPPMGENVEANHPSNTVGDWQVRELLAQSRHHCLPNSKLLVILLKIFPLLSTTIPSDWRHV